MIRSSRSGGVVAIVQAGGRGSRMEVLTRDRAKPALPFGGHYQLIDFALTSLAHSGITDVWVGVQWQASSLARHVANGRPWDLDRTQGGLRWLVPEQGGDGEGFSEGNADDLARRLDDIRARAPRALVVMSADSVWAMDLRDVVEEHLRSGASCTAVTVEGSEEQARAKAVLVHGDDGVVTEVAYKSDDPPSRTIAAEIFVYDTSALIDALESLGQDLEAIAGDDHDDGGGLGDFGETLLPWLVEHGTVRVHPLQGYWRDMGTPADYLQGHRDLVAGEVDVVGLDDWPILTRWPEMPPARVSPGATLDATLLSAGCVVHGTVRRSVLGPGVVVEEGAVVEDAVVCARTRVQAGAHVATAVVDARCSIGRDARVGRLVEGDLDDEQVTLVGRRVTVATGGTVEPGARVEPGTDLTV